MRLVGFCGCCGVLSGCYGVARMFWVVVKWLLGCFGWLLRVC